MVRDTILTAFIAGLVAALFLTVVQAVWITLLILQAEGYEEAGEAPAAADSVATATAEAHHGHEQVEHDHDAPAAHDHDATVAHDHDTPAAHDHDTPAAHDHDATVAHDHDATVAHDHASGYHHDGSGWKPHDGWQRTAFTFGANLLLGISYSLVLVSLFLLWREPKNLATGLAYGLAGFGVFFVAPALGLPPELPGTAAADLVARQQWWLLTAAVTAIGLLLFFSYARLWTRALALALIVAPHLIPAPHPAVESSLAPAALQSEFRLATTIGNALFWLVLGLASTYVYLNTCRSRKHP